MPADKIVLKAKLYNLFVNLGFGAAYICDDTVILYDILKLCEIFRPSPKASSMVC